eukprot:g1351.t1
MRRFRTLPIDLFKRDPFQHSFHTSSIAMRSGRGNGNRSNNVRRRGGKRSGPKSSLPGVEFKTGHAMGFGQGRTGCLTIPFSPGGLVPQDNCTSKQKDRAHRLGLSILEDVEDAHFLTKKMRQTTFQPRWETRKKKKEELAYRRFMTDLRHDILEASLQYVPTHGWTKESLAMGAQNLNLSPAAIGMFENGPFALVDFFMKESTLKLRQDLPRGIRELEQNSSEQGGGRIGITDKVKLGIRTRLEYLLPYSRTWNQAIALGALPENIPQTTENLAAVSNEIWDIVEASEGEYTVQGVTQGVAQDSSRINHGKEQGQRDPGESEDKLHSSIGNPLESSEWYTKRFLIGTIYASCEIYLVSDYSERHVDTWGFLDRRMEDAVTFGSTLNNSSDVQSAVALGIQSMLRGTSALADPQGTLKPFMNIAQTVAKIGVEKLPVSTEVQDGINKVLGTALNLGRESKRGYDHGEGDLGEGKRDDDAPSAQSRDNVKGE